MPNFSLITVKGRHGDRIDGEWIQNAVGTTLEEATQRAINYERKVWGVQTEVAVTPEVPSSTPHGMWYNLPRLDKDRRYS